MSGPVEPNHVDGRVAPRELAKELRRLAQSSPAPPVVLTLGGEGPPRPGAFEAVLAFPGPVVATLEGDLTPDDLAIALACDYIVAAAGTDLPIDRGLSPGLGWLLARRLGSRATALAFRDGPLDSDEALGLGLIDEVRSPAGSDLRQVAGERASAVAASPRAAALSRAIAGSHRLTLEEAIGFEGYLLEAAGDASPS